MLTNTPNIMIFGVIFGKKNTIFGMFCEALVIMRRCAARAARD